MRLEVFGSGSKGNCYLLYNESEALLLEAGLPFARVVKFMKGSIGRIRGCLVTHEHADHAKFVKDVLNSGIDTYMTPGTYEAFMDHHKKVYTWLKNPKRIEIGKLFSLGGFTILPFRTVHDASEPCGYLIQHEEMGNLLFATDTSYIPNTFAGLNQVLIECNYDERLLSAREDIPDSLKDRIRGSHMSIDTCIDALAANDRRFLRNIVLIHISEGDGDPDEFTRRVSERFRWETMQIQSASSGLDIELNILPF